MKIVLVRSIPGPHIFQKKLQSDSVLIRLKLASVLIRAHLYKIRLFQYT